MSVMEVEEEIKLLEHDKYWRTVLDKPLCLIWSSIFPLRRKLTPSNVFFAFKAVLSLGLLKRSYLYLLLSGMDTTQPKRAGLLMWQKTVVRVTQTLLRDIYSDHFHRLSCTDSLCSCFQVTAAECQHGREKLIVRHEMILWTRKTVYTLTQQNSGSLLPQIYFKSRHNSLQLGIMECGSKLFKFTFTHWVD